MLVWCISLYCCASWALTCWLGYRLLSWSVVVWVCILYVVEKLVVIDNPINLTSGGNRAEA